MPYDGERANKAAHIDIIKNPEISDFLSKCKPLRVPGDTEIKQTISNFSKVVLKDGGGLPEYLVATDGSYYESAVHVGFPSTKIAYLKFGTVMVRLTEFNALHVEGTHMVDPFKVAALDDGNSSVTLALPSANVVLQGHETVRDSFRAAVDAWFRDGRTRLDENDPKSSLISTLGLLSSLRDGGNGSTSSNKVSLHQCPSCGAKDIEVVIDADNLCPAKECGAPLYATDSLRLWEEVSEYQSNATAVGRLMMVVEHILPIHYINFLAKHNPQILESMIFFIDGPLGIFGTSAWLHRPIQRFLFETFAYLEAKGYKPPIIVGLQKTGQVVDFATSLDSHLSPSSLLSISDNYRYKFILSGRPESKNCFGDETYYGQDFIFKSASGKIFVLGVPYPCRTKRPLEHFTSVKDQVLSYPSLQRVLATIQAFESDLHMNAIIPISLAHKYTSISLAPGGRILDILSRTSLTRT